jgi:hypothetical protein
MTTETRTYVGLTGGPGGFDGYAGLRINKTYTGTHADDGTVRVTAEGSTPVTLKKEEWESWFKR